MTRGGGSAAIVKRATKFQVATILGGGVAHKGIFLVEDEGAKSFLRVVLDERDAELSSQFEIAVAGDESKITAAVIAMPRTRASIILGAYDGDMRSKEESIRRKVEKEAGAAEGHLPYLFLPGAMPPERLLKDTVDSAKNVAGMLADDLHKTPEDIFVALDHVAGLDYHDFVIELARALSLAPSVMYGSLVRIWLRDNSNSQAVDGFLQEIRNAIDAH